METLFFYGSLPKQGQSPTGGGEVGNQRTVKMLESFGYHVKTIRKLGVPSSSSKFRRFVSYPFRFFYGIMAVTVTILLGGKNGVFHLSGFAGQTLFNELLISRIVKHFKFTLIYELRGGGVLPSYENGNRTYRNRFRSVLNLADVIFSQGKENFDLIHSLCNKPLYHYPNCVENGFYPNGYIGRTTESYNIIYFGRLKPAKNILLIVQIVGILQKRVKNVKLTIIGNGLDSYINKVQNEIDELLEDNSAMIIQGCTHDELKRYLRNKHFFVFPSQQPLEGQSNALTEAMSYGIVPIVSPQGFNATTVGNKYLVVDNYDAQDYAQRIFEIINSDKFGYYSRYVYNHFMDNYTQEIVYDRFRHIYHDIIAARG